MDQSFNKLGYKAIVIGGSAGSFPVVLKILSNLPKTFKLPIILCLHRLKHFRHGFMEVLNLESTLPVIEPDDKDIIKNGIVYLAPANYHLYIELNNTFALSTEELVNTSRPAIDLTFETASYCYKEKMIGIMLSGANSDGAKGFKLAKKRGAFTIVQSPEEATIKTMPTAALKATEVDLILTSAEIVDFIKKLV